MTISSSEKTARARFAPSPTGPMHAGSVRTALLNWLFVRSVGGTLLLRIDDTDRERSKVAWEEAILGDMAWLGLDWDDGPVYQSDRSARYREALHEVPTVDRGGAYEFGGRIIAKPDGSALYNLASAVDDMDDGITHVLRGRDHLANTDLQRSIIEALGGDLPVYVHAPLLTLGGGAKVSKRVEAAATELAGLIGDDGNEEEGQEVSTSITEAPPALTVAALRETGYPPLAVLNALALSLADFGVDEVMLSLDEMAARFSLDHLHTADSRFDAEKLRWVSGQHIRSMSDEALKAEVVSRLNKPVPDVAVAAARTAGATLVECAEVVADLLSPPPPDDEAIAAAGTPEALAALKLLVSLWDGQPADPVVASALFDSLKKSLKEDGVKLGPSLHGLRAVLTGRVQGVEFPYVLATLSAERLEKVAELLQ